MTNTHDDQVDEARIKAIMCGVENELRRATRKHAPMRTSHEAFGVIYEEFNIEFAAAMHQNDLIQQRKEMFQVAAMACRFLYDIGASPKYEDMARRDAAFHGGR